MSEPIAADIHCAKKTDVAYTCANVDDVFTALDLPGVGLNVKVTEGVVLKSKCHTAALTCLKMNLGKCAKRLSRSVIRAVGLANVKLGNLATLSVARVGDSEGYFSTVNFKVGILKGGVGETVAKGIANANTCGIVVAVTNVETLTVLCGALLGGIIIIGRIVLKEVRPALVQLTRGVNYTHNCVSHSRCACLTTEVAVNCGSVHLSLRHNEGRTARENENYVLVNSCYVVNKLLLTLRKIHMKAIHTL